MPTSSKRQQILDDILLRQAAFDFSQCGQVSDSSLISHEDDDDEFKRDRENERKLAYQKCATHLPQGSEDLPLPSSHSLIPETIL